MTQAPIEVTVFREGIQDLAVSEEAPRSRVLFNLLLGFEQHGGDPVLDLAGGVIHDNRARAHAAELFDQRGPLFAMRQQAEAEALVRQQGQSDMDFFTMNFGACLNARGYTVK